MKHLIFSIILSFSSFLFSQDKLITLSGAEYSGTYVGVKGEKVEFIQSGKTTSVLVLKSSIKNIILSNGEIVNLSDGTSQSVVQSSNQQVVNNNPNAENMTTGISGYNPCEDERYLDIKKKPLDDMTDREYTYFMQKDKECAEYKPSQLNKSEVIKSTIVKKHEEPFQQEDILSGLDEEQRKSYMKNKLNIELKAKTSGGAYGGSSVVSYSGETSTKWEAYKGFDKISEEQFFQLTGYTDEAKLAQVFSSNSNKMGYGGCLAAIVGFLLFGRGEALFDEIDFGSNDQAYLDREVDKSDSLHGNGAFLMLSGTILSVYGFMRRDQNWTAYSTVQGITNEYNNKLLQEISNK